MGMTNIAAAQNKIFAKPIKGGKSEFELSTEEQEVLQKSK
jgi:hypothetical protein